MLLSDLQLRIRWRSEPDPTSAARGLSSLMAMQSGTTDWECFVRPGHILVTVRSPLDASSAEQFRQYVAEKLARYNATRVVLDLAETPVIDEEGVRTIQELDAACQLRGGAVLCAQMSLEAEVALRGANLAIALRIPPSWPRRMPA